jgi:quercetin dioxygenase-like cupin family protein
MKKYQLSRLILSLLAVTTLCFSQTGQEKKDTAASSNPTSTHVVVTPGEVKWGPAPPGLPATAQFAVLEGDPSKQGMFVIRGKFPDGYKVAPHWHPTDERIVVIQGTFGMGMGEKFDPAAGRELTAGSYAMMPQGMRHFAWAKGDTIIQVSGMGPFQINYVNSADDPRTATPK